MVKMIVPGHTTKVNFSASHVYDLDGFFLEGLFEIKLRNDKCFRRLQTEYGRLFK